ncbi:MAG: PQQ-dependent sugar dehydrogenase [Pirellulales bacterium]
MKTLGDRDGDGVYESSTVVMNDLTIPSSILLDDDWVYLTSLGSVVRHRRSTPGGPFDVREEIIRGLCGFHHHQASGMTLSHDNWLFVTAGDDDNHGEGSDGSRVTVLRCGVVVRSRPDGSQLTEFARGLRNPYRNVVFDDYFNMFHVDNDNEDGSKFQGCRLMNVQEGADYGWRLAQGTICCRTDLARGAVFGEAPGKMPSMLKTGRGAPAGLLIYQGTHFPDFFRGLLIYPDVYRKLVRAYAVERAGSTFRVTHQFVLIESDDPLFRPARRWRVPTARSTSSTGGPTAAARGVSGATASTAALSTQLVGDRCRAGDSIGGDGHLEPDRHGRRGRALGIARQPRLRCPRSRWRNSSAADRPSLSGSSMSHWTTRGADRPVPWRSAPRRSSTMNQSKQRCSHCWNSAATRSCAGWPPTRSVGTRPQSEPVPN